MTTTFTLADPAVSHVHPLEDDPKRPAGTDPQRCSDDPNLNRRALPPAQAARRRRNPRADLAEGVISTAIAVLVIAFLGLLMWVGFRVMFNSATTKANQTIEQIGN